MRRLYYSIKALTPLHVGVGTGLGHIDLPIQREVHTKFPMIPGSAVKGALREHKLREMAKQLKRDIKELDRALQECDGIDLNHLKDLFGCQNQAGRLAFSDLRILLFPVKSLNGIFAYVTSPDVLERLAEDLEIEFNRDMFKVEQENQNRMFRDDEALVSLDISKNLISKEDNKIVVLEEFTFDVFDFNNELVNWLADTFGKLGVNFEEIVKRLIIVSDNAFNDFVQNFTEVQTHVKIDPAKGTVQAGALWTEEYLPAETYMYGIIFETRDVSGNSQKDLLVDVLPDYLHLGGDITTGKGFVKINSGGIV